MGRSLSLATTSTNVDDDEALNCADGRNPLDFLLTQSQQLAAVLTMGLYFQYFVYRTERLMDSYLRRHTFLQQLRDSVAPSPER
jgi:hypothetical protein